MFHTLVGYLHGRLNAENEKDKKKSSKVINKMQGLVSKVIMKNKYFYDQSFYKMTVKQFMI